MHSQCFEISCTGKHAPRKTYDFASHFGAHVAQIWFLHIKSLGKQSMYKNGRMMSVFKKNNTTLRLSSHVHCRKSLTCLRVAVVVRDVCVCVWGVGERYGGTLWVVNLRVGLLIILWVIYATSKSRIGYLKHYTSLSYIMFVPHSCIGHPLRHSSSCGYQRRAHWLASKGFKFPPTTWGINLTKRWIHLGMCVVWIMVGFHIKVRARAYTLPPAWSEGATRIML